MPVVNYTNNHNTALTEFVAFHSSLNSELYELCFSTFQGVLGQPGLAPTENCFVLEHAGAVKGVALVFREFAISRSVIEVMTASELDRKSTRLNSSHGVISYAVFCLKKNTHSLHNSP